MLHCITTILDFVMFVMISNHSIDAIYDLFGRTMFSEQIFCIFLIKVRLGSLRRAPSPRGSRLAHWDHCHLGARCTLLLFKLRLQ